MFKLHLKDKITLIGVIVLSAGIGLLLFTFISAYGFLAQDLSILTSSDLAQTFGDALAPLISTCIRIMYLGVMGWIGSLLTIRGVTLLSQQRQISSVTAQEKIVSKEKAKEEVKEETKVIPEVKKTDKPATETKKPEPEQVEPVTQPESQPEPQSVSEPKPYEPEIVMLPPKTVEQVEQEKPQTDKEQK
jgi:hypothetical protein